MSFEVCYFSVQAELKVEFTGIFVSSGQGCVFCSLSHLDSRTYQVKASGVQCGLLVKSVTIL